MAWCGEWAAPHPCHAPWAPGVPGVSKDAVCRSPPFTTCNRHVWALGCGRPLGEARGNPFPPNHAITGRGPLRSVIPAKAGTQGHRRGIPRTPTTLNRQATHPFFPTYRGNPVTMGWCGEWAAPRPCHAPWAPGAPGVSITYFICPPPLFRHTSSSDIPGKPGVSKDAVC